MTVAIPTYYLLLVVPIISITYVVVKFRKDILTLVVECCESLWEDRKIFACALLFMIDFISIILFLAYKFPSHK